MRPLPSRRADEPTAYSTNEAVAVQLWQREWVVSRDGRGFRVFADYRAQEDGIELADEPTLALALSMATLKVKGVEV